MNLTNVVSGRTPRIARVAAVISLLVFPIVSTFPKSTLSTKSAPEADPWVANQTVEPAALATELQQGKSPFAQVIYVGVRTLYEGAHIPGAVFHGPGSTPEGLADLKNFASTLPRNSKILIYCGCCPLERCPNLRPAFRTLKEMGFNNLRVLILPTSFAADWVQKGYPIQKGQ